MAAPAAQRTRHSGLVRVTHWITAVNFVALLVSGIAILLAHPRLYWGEAGSVGTPSLMDLPLPFFLTGQTGWGRSLHFLAAWICIATGWTYGIAGLASGHFRRDLLPSSFGPYNFSQRVAYALVVFALFPLTIWTGLAMSPSLTSVFPTLVTLLGGQQSARTIHFFVACSLVVFLAAHVAMVSLNGFQNRMLGMITGRVA